MNTSSQNNFYLIESQSGPPLQDNYVKTLQESLDSIRSATRVRALTAAEFMTSTPEHGVIWPYFRGVPSKHEDVLGGIDRQDFGIINDYTRGEYNLSNKWRNYQHAEQVGVPIPISFSIDNEADFNELSLTYPIVVKGYPSGRGEDVHLCQDIREAHAAYQSCIEKGLGVVAQEYIEESHGKDLRVLVVDGEIACMLGRKGAKGQFLSNVSQGGEYFEPDLKTDQLHAIKNAVGKFPVDVAGFDFLFSNKGLLFCEINLAPGSTGKATAMLPHLARLIHSRTPNAY